MDIKTLFLSSHILNSILTLFVFVLWFYYRKVFRGISYFLFGIFFIAVGNLGIGLREHCGLFFSIVVSNVMIVLGLVLVTQSLIRFLLKKSVKYELLIYILPLITLLEQIYFSYVSPSLVVRIVFISGLISLMMFSNILLIICSNNLKTLPGVLMFLNFLVLGVSMFVRSIFTPYTLHTQSFLSSGDFQAYSIFIWMIAIITWTLSIIILIFNKLKKNEEEQVKEKEQLIGEIDHRIKNNLNAIHALLNLQYTTCKDAKVKKIIRQIDNRIAAVSKIHSLLYRTYSSSVHIKEYLTEIIKNVIHNYELRHVDVIINIEDLLIAFASAMNLGLIVNELVTNACKYAYSDKQKGFLKITFYTAENTNTNVLEICDSGKGLPEDFDLAKTDTMGMALVNDIVRQLSGDMEIKSDKEGSCFQISIPHT